MKLKTSLKYAAGAVAIMVGSAGSVNAAVQAQAFIDMTGFTISTFDGETIGPVLDATTDITLVTRFNTTDISADLNGNQLTFTDNGSINTDSPPLCVGSGCPAVVDNAFDVLLTPPLTDYVVADQRDLGSPVANSDDGLGGVLPTGADVSVGSWASLATGLGDASATGNNGLTATFDFIMAADSALAFEFSVESYLGVFMGADEIAGSAAQAQTTFSFRLTDETTGQLIAIIIPQVYNQGQLDITGPTFSGMDDNRAGLGYTIGSALVADFTGMNAFITPTLIAGRQYKLTAEMSARADVTRVPAPGTLLLLGLGILGLGAAKKRKLAA